MSVLLGLCVACGWLMLTDKQPQMRTTFLTIWALSSLIAYCLTYQNNEE